MSSVSKPQKNQIDNLKQKNRPSSRTQSNSYSNIQTGQSQQSKNLTNEEYLKLLDLQNKQKQDLEQQNKDQINRKKLEEREKGFNTYLAGANQDRQAQPYQSKIQNNQRGARRQWRDPSKSNERELSRSPINTLGANAYTDIKLQQSSVYHNPFDLQAQSNQYDQTNPNALVNAFKKQYKKDSLPQEDSETQLNKNIQISNRKKWGASKLDPPEQQIDEIILDEDIKKTNKKNKFKSSQRLAGSDDEDNYSDDFDVQIDSNINLERKNNLQIIQENVNESKDHDISFIPDTIKSNIEISEESKNDQDQSCAHIEMFLKTATEKEMDIIRESLSNFQEFQNIQAPSSNSKQKDKGDKKNKKVIAIEEDNIEEEFEEEIPEDTENRTSEDEEYKFEKKAQEQRAAGKKNRPVSAVYDIQQFKAKNSYSTNDGTNSFRLNQNGAQSQVQILPHENINLNMPLIQKDSLNKFPKVDNKSSLLKQFPQNKSQMSLKRPDEEELRLNQETKKQQIQPNKQIQPPQLATNPFKRPFSYANPSIKSKNESNLQVPKKLISNDYNSSSQIVSNQKFEEKLPAYGSQKIQSLAMFTKNYPPIAIETSYGIQSTNSVVSKKDEELNQIMTVISNLDDTQRHGLLNILKDKLVPKIEIGDNFMSSLNNLKGAESQRNFNVDKDFLQKDLDSLNQHVATVQQKSTKNQLKMPNKFGLHDPINPFNKKEEYNFDRKDIPKGNSQLGNIQNLPKVPLQKNHQQSLLERKNSRQSIDKNKDFDKKSNSRTRQNNVGLNKRFSIDQQKPLMKNSVDEQEQKPIPIWLQNIQDPIKTQNASSHQSYSTLPIKNEVNDKNLNRRQIQQKQKMLSEKDQQNQIQKQFHQQNIESASKDVMKAINSVNNAVFQQQKMNDNTDDFKKIEESFECLDMFKFTNKGRIQVQEKLESHELWSASNNNRKEIVGNEHKMYSNQDIQQDFLSNPDFASNSKASVKSTRKAPKLIKSNIMPEEFILPSPSQKKQIFSSNLNIPDNSVNSQKFNPSTSEQIIKALESQKDKEEIQKTPNFDKKQLEEKEFLNQFYKELNFSELKKDQPIILKQKFQNDDSLVDELEKELDNFGFSNKKIPNSQMINSKKGFEIQQNINEKQVIKLMENQHSREEIYKNKLKSFQDPFIIPVLPRGRQLEFNIVQTWGDINYVGLTGIEVFDEQGKQIFFNGKKDISANPSDINLLMGYGSDPRTVDKLVDGTYFTNDDFHAWLTPFTQGEDHTITMKLPGECTISMIRIWNYNKSRIHSYRGARLITCKIDDKFIFKGEIQKAPGNNIHLDQCCEIILFTQDEQIFKKIDQNDWVQNINLKNDTDQIQENDIDQNSWDNEQERPMTATKKFGNDEILDMQRALFNPDQKPTSIFDERPQTKAIKRINRLPEQNNDFNEIDNQQNLELDDFKPQQIIRAKPSNKKAGVKGRLIELIIRESWGDMFYVGLNGIEIRDINDNIIPIDIKKMEANPRDMNSIPDHGQDHRTLDKLINGINNTVSDLNMWLIPFNLGEDHTIKIDLGKQVQIGSIKFYNYNKSLEDSLRGVKQIIIKVDGNLQTPVKGITLRKAPGYIMNENPLMCSDIGQVVCLPYNLGWKSNMIVPLQKIPMIQNTELNLLQEYDPISTPIGFSFRINLFSTQGDHYYIGLNGIELYDQLGKLIKIDSQKCVYANPSGISSVKGMESDIRTIDKLFNQNNLTFDDKNMWLAPFKFTRSHAAANSQKQDSDKREPNFISITFNEPVAISAIKIYNYSKTSKRGVNEFELLMDDRPIFRGFAKKAPDSQEEWIKSNKYDFATSVIFSRDVKIINQFKKLVNFEPMKQQEVLMYNEKIQINQNIKQRQNENFVFNENERPQTKYGGK